MNIEETLSKEGHIEYLTKGYSMLPMLKEGSLVKLVQSKEYNLYDVVLFKKENDYILHRIIKIDNDIYYIKGDNNSNIDKVNIKDLLGKLEGFYLNDTYIKVNDSIYLEYISSYVNNVNKNQYLDKDDYLLFEAFHEVIRYGINGKCNIALLTNLSEHNLVRLVKLTYQNKCGHILALINNKYNLNIPEKYVVTLNKVLDIAKLNFLRQMDAKKIISETLKENEIRHLYIKWADIVDNINVDPYIRTANDIDIYIEEKHIDKIRDIFIDVFDGVETPSDTSIHYAFTLRKLGVHVEVHHKLLDKYLSSVTSILSDPFKHGYIDKNNHYLYHLTKEYYYLYNLAHLSKHTLFCELYFNIIFDMNYLINDSSINKEMVNDLIKKAKLEDFHKFIKGYISYLLTDSLQSYEVYAYERYMMYNHKNKNIVYQKRKYKTKFSYLWHKVFLPYKELCFIFPKLKKHKLLLPIYQVKRWCIRLKDNRMKNVKYELDHFSSILTNEELNNIYSSIGLKEVHDLLKKVA